MKPYASVLSACFLAAGAALLLSQHKQGPLAFVQNNATFDAGRVQAGRQVSHVFLLKNPQSFPVQVETPADDCGCSLKASVKLITHIIPSYGTLPVTVTATARGEEERTESVEIVTRHENRTQNVWLFIRYAAAAPRP